MKSINAMLALCSLIYSTGALAQAEFTVSNYSYINSEISKIKESGALSYDHYRAMFSQTPEYNVTCYTDAENPQAKSRHELDNELQKFLPNYLEGTMKFEIETFDMGFNIFQTTELDWVDGKLKSMVSCIGGVGSCGSVDVSAEEIFNKVPESEDYRVEEAKKSQSFSTYVYDFNTLYFTHNITLSVPETSMFSRSRTSRTAQAVVNYVCVARLKDSKVGN